MNLSTRLRIGLRFLLLMAGLVGIVGIVGHLIAWPLLTTTVGPTAYVFVSNPLSEAARLRNALLGHGVAIGIGVGCFCAFGVGREPSVSALGMPTWEQVGASVLGVSVTLCVLELLRSHHAPAAATVLLLTTGLANPGRPLAGLILGLAITIVVGPLSGRLPLFRVQTEAEEGRRR